MDLRDDATPGDELAARPASAGSRLVDRARAWVGWFGTGRLIAVALSVVAVVAGGVWLLREPPPPTEAGLPYAGVPSAATVTGGGGSAAPAAVPSTVTAEVTVHVAGAVERPGVYTLASGARVHTAIDAAGGARPRGDPGALNLAAPVVDGERVYVPAVGETIPVPAEVAATPTGSAPAVGMVDVNQATIAELDTLPGIGPATAQAIIDHRSANGPFAAVDDLEAVRGIGPAKLEAIRPLVQV